MINFPEIEAKNVYLQHLKIILVGRNVQKLLCVLNAIRRKMLQIINKKIHENRKKMKKWQAYHMMLKSLFTAF